MGFCCCCYCCFYTSRRKDTAIGVNHVTKHPLFFFGGGGMEEIVSSFCISFLVLLLFSFCLSSHDILVRNFISIYSLARSSFLYMYEQVFHLSWLRKKCVVIKTVTMQAVPSLPGETIVPLSHAKDHERSRVHCLCNLLTAPLFSSIYLSHTHRRDRGGNVCTWREILTVISINRCDIQKDMSEPKIDPTTPDSHFATNRAMTA